MKCIWILILSLAWSWRLAAAPGPINPFVGPEYKTSISSLDACVQGRLKKLGLDQAGPCSDAVFLRRVYLDLTGTIPSAEEANRFLLSERPDKRKELISSLLASEGFVDYWTLKWCDTLRVKAEFPINLWPNAAQAYHRWIRQTIRTNMPADRFARELLTASGSNFRVPPVNFFRAMQNREAPGIAQTVALTFMGCRADKWSEERQQDMAAFFAHVGFKETSEWKEEIIFNEVLKSNSWCRTSAKLPDGTLVHFDAETDPRQPFADWLVAPRNPWFARALANRTWSWIFGRGIVHEADDLRPDNPPANPELLAFLEQELIRSHFDTRHLLSVILNSRTYQQSTTPAKPSPEATAQFAHYPLRRLDAEVLIDVLNKITGSSEKYTSAIPEPFTYIPDGFRAVCLPDGSISSSFLELFGKPARDTGMDSERNNRITSAQRLHLLNSTHIQKKIAEGGRLNAFFDQGGNSKQIISGLYLTILSRFPTPDEVDAALAHAQSGDRKKREAAQDLAWALINSSEFLFKH
jgi:hypothetical protein